jgi:hypothetical protein
MSNRFSYFNTASRIFWILFGLILIFCLFRFDKLFFNQDGIVERILPKKDETVIPDTIPPISSDTGDLKTFVWEWATPQTSWKLKGKEFKIVFQISEEAISASEKNHNAPLSRNENFYEKLYLHDASIIHPMVDRYKELAIKNKLNYIETLEMVVSSIQSIPYTWILLENPSCGQKYRGQVIPPKNCLVNPEPNGCCDGVKYGVYSPVEFAVKKTGDCDTRTLFAFTILKKMGFDIAIMGSSSEWHSVLGVNILGYEPGNGHRGNIGEAKNYFLWELTTYGPYLGVSYGGNDWEISLK